MKSLELFLTILLSIGATQGIVYGVILVKKNAKNSIANRFLAAILFFFSYRLIVEICKLFGYGFFDFWYHIFIEFNWIYGALIYFFVKAATAPNFKFRIQKEWIHFLPVFLEFGWSIFIKSQNFYWDGTRESLSWLGYYGYILWMHYPTMYVIAGLLIVFYSVKSSKFIQYQKTKNFIDAVSIRWIETVLKVLKYYALGLILVVLIDLIWFNYAFQQIYRYPLFAGLAIITYWLGLVGFNKRNEIRLKNSSLISEEELYTLKTTAASLEKLMFDKKLYLNPELNLSILSKELNTKAYITTKCLNLIIGKKFNDYINGYRIEALKNLLKKEENKKFTLLSLAFQVGFNSKASFNRAVKKYTGKSPKHLKPIH